MTGIDIYGQISHPMYVTDALMLLMHRCCWCAGAAHAADPTDVLMLLIGWCCWCADSVLCSPSPMHCNATEWQQSVKNLHWRSVVKNQGNWEQLTEVGLMMHQRCKYMTRKGLEKHGCALWKMVVEWDYHIWTWWKCLGGGAGIIISPDDESGCLGGGGEIFISSDYESGCILELHGGGEEVGSNQTMNPPGAAGSQHCWRQHSGDPSSSTLEQLYTL